MYKKRFGDKIDGCVMFFKELRFILVKLKFVFFNKLEVKLMDRDNVVVVVLLKFKNIGSLFRYINNMVCVFNIYLFFNKKRGDIKFV